MGQISYEDYINLAKNDAHKRELLKELEQNKAELKDLKRRIVKSETEKEELRKNLEWSEALKNDLKKELAKNETHTKFVP